MRHEVKNGENADGEYFEDYMYPLWLDSTETITLLYINIVFVIIF